ncbi:MAG: amidohydrolase family protein [Candidatus Paceibacterota bacterium]|jgi:N-acyl-D-amino-acid deacylase
MTTLIKNAVIYDGSGAPPVKKDILIRDGYIVKIDTISRGHADETIDAAGAMVTPGFIDVTTHSDHHMSLLYEPYQEDFVRQGITTIIGGNCGVSLAPLIDGSLVSLREWGSEFKENIGWHSIREFLALLSKKGVGLNFGTLVGHTTIRRALTRNKFRDLTESEVDAFKKILSMSLKEGAFGFSTGLEHTHTRRTPFNELKELLTIVAKHRGVYATHLRDSKENLIDAVKETLSLSEETGCNVEISHLQPLKAFSALYREAAELIEHESSKQHIHFDIHPFETAPFLIYELLPEWFHEEYLETMREHLHLKVLQERLFDHFKKLPARDYIITHVPDPSLKFLEGVSIREFAIRSEKRFEESLLALMDMTALRATVSAKVVDEELLQLFLTHPNSIISSNTASFGKKEFKTTQSTSTFPAFLSLVMEKKILSVEKAIQKITSLPAQKYSIEKRGLIKEGYYADLVILSKDRPRDVFINGICVLHDETYTPTLAGMVLRKTN